MFREKQIQFKRMGRIQFHQHPVCLAILQSIKQSDNQNQWTKPTNQPTNEPIKPTNQSNQPTNQPIKPIQFKSIEIRGKVLSATLSCWASSAAWLTVGPCRIWACRARRMRSRLLDGAWSRATVDGSEIRNTHLGCIESVVNNGRNYQPQLVHDFWTINSTTLWATPSKRENFGVMKVSRDAAKAVEWFVWQASRYVSG